MVNQTEKTLSGEYETKVFLSSYSCERRELDAQKILSYLKKNNYTIITDPKKADYIILVTYGATKSLSDISFKMIEKFKEYDAQLIVAGCIPETHKEQLGKIFTGITLPTQNFDRIDEIFPINTIQFKDAEEGNYTWKNLNKRTPSGILKNINQQSIFFRTLTTFFIENIFKKILGRNFVKIFPFKNLVSESGNYFILISRGCIHNCAYCIIRKAVGPLRSKPSDQCINEFREGLQQGFTNFVLEADDVGPYGVDIGGTLPDLLKQIVATEGNFTLELRNTHPFWIIKYIDDLETLVKTRKIKSIFISIQSGNNRILKLMGRPYPIEKVVDAVSRLKSANPDLQVGVDLMVGFPTEKTEEFHETLRIIEQLHFDFGVVFPFCCHQETKASQIEPKIPRKVIQQRLSETLRMLKQNNYFAWRFRSTGFISFYTR